jgi:DNA repair protein RecO (recombination protein O)
MRNLGDNDRIVEFLTREHGRLSAVARGARSSRKRYGGRLEKFICTEIRVVQRTSGALGRLEDIRVKEVFSELGSDLGRLAMAEALLELAGKTSVPGEHGQAIFDWLLAGWRVIQEGSCGQSGFYLLLLTFLQQQGMLAALDQCVACAGAPDGGFFIAAEGGLFCRACRTRGIAVTPGLSRLFKTLGSSAQPEDLVTVVQESFRGELRLLAIDAMRAQLGAELRSLRAWEELRLND